MSNLPRFTPCSPPVQELPPRWRDITTRQLIVCASLIYGVTVVMELLVALIAFTEGFPPGKVGVFAATTLQGLALCIGPILAGHWLGRRSRDRRAVLYLLLVISPWIIGAFGGALLSLDPSYRKHEGHGAPVPWLTYYLTSPDGGGWLLTPIFLGATAFILASQTVPRRFRL